MKEFPTPEEWKAATDAGFRSNGSSLSPDTIYLARIANGDNRYPPLPADLHDYRYWQGGSEEDRKAADHEFLEGLLAVVEKRVWRLFQPLARTRAHEYYEAVHFAGFKFFKYKEPNDGTAADQERPDRTTQ